MSERARIGGERRAEVLSPEERSAIASKGGHARFQGLTKAQRSQLARLALEARWGKRAS